MPWGVHVDASMKLRPYRFGTVAAETEGDTGIGNCIGMTLAHVNGMALHTPDDVILKMTSLYSARLHFIRENLSPHSTLPLPKGTQQQPAAQRQSSTALHAVPSTEGEKVQVRDTPREAWKPGTVTGWTGSKPLVKLDGAKRSFTWIYVEGVHGSEEEDDDDDKE